ncbi:Rieske (2Fe-2S) protein [Streptomyces phyllanthi]|uniref:Cytochrome bc1 complex Rieske iron-sulfur subunit n=1 Tax=Streptomyces phyllanthi TaxID=1803180 RepID=A0A5N8W426_9ACTN|nr:Rieske (2Fe-2S) protein [Streptomyces phyllanthi]MPY42059.1 Rieske (2Fe-2S) protein [Streptomyces phyllanthi]
MTSAPHQPVSKPARRAVIAAAGATGLAVALTACGSEDDSSSASSDSTAAGTEESSSSSGGDSSGGDAGSGGAELAKTSDIPEGGGKVFESEGVVVTQPEAGTFKAFSSSCTHQGCAVKSIANGVINCPCHNSNFSITDGSVKSGPATKPLPAKQISVDGESIKLA